MSLSDAEVVVTLSPLPHDESNLNEPIEPIGRTKYVADAESANVAVPTRAIGQTTV